MEAGSEPYPRLDSLFMLGSYGRIEGAVMGPPYSGRMKKLIEDPEKFYKDKKRTSGHDTLAARAAWAVAGEMASYRRPAEFNHQTLPKFGGFWRPLVWRDVK
jgi:hypothetical protein